ncbi:MAG: UbiD family decarboxylase [Planctomycetes bacterium]|nr:UbiD family decarboxylase [Planctomycetota bacterium]
MSAPRDLGAFLGLLARERELVTVEAEVDPELELAEIHRRVIAAGGPALLFKRVKGCDFPLATNLFGTQRRIERAFGPEPQRLLAEVAKLPQVLVPPTLGKLWKKRELFLRLARVGAKERAGGAVTEVVEAPRLTRLPAIRTWKRDGGRFFTLPLVATRHPETLVPNLGMYRIQVYDDATTGLHMQIGKGGGFHLAAAEALDRPLPVVIHLGGPPALTLAAIAPLPENVPETLVASLVLGERLGLARNRHNELPLFAEAEVALVGEVLPRERRPEGPFGDHYGYYSERHDYPVFRCQAVYRRRAPVIPATVVGKPRQEDFFLGDYLQELLSPLFPLAMPSVRDLWSYGETGYHSLAAAVVHERYKREAMASAFRILGEGQLSLTKFLLAVDRPLELRDFKSVLTHVLARADFRTDLYLFANLSMDSLDYAGPRINEGGKGVLLGLGEPIRELPREFTGAPRAPVKTVKVFSPGCLVLDGPAFADEASERRTAAAIAADPAFAHWPLLVLSDDAARAARSAINFLWTTFTRFDPGRDLHAQKIELVHAHASFTPPLVIDARKKPGYPEELFCDPDTARLVERRWKEYFPAGGVEMGDSEHGHLSP